MRSILFQLDKFGDKYYFKLKSIKANIAQTIGDRFGE